MKDKVITKFLYRGDFLNYGVRNENFNGIGFQVNMERLGGAISLRGEVGRMQGSLNYQVWHVNDCTLIYNCYVNGDKSKIRIEATGRENKVSGLRKIVDKLKKGISVS